MLCPPRRASRPCPGHQVGSTIALLFSPLLIDAGGVSFMFYLYGLLGIFWVAAWEPVVSSEPPLMPGEDRDERSRPVLRLVDLPWRSVSASLRMQRRAWAEAA
jgi:hypothetical protein